MRTLVALALVAGISLSGCSTLLPIIDGGSVAEQAPATVVGAEKILSITHLAYQGIGISLREAALSGALHGVDAAVAKDLFDRAGAFLDAADQADALANAQGIMDNVSAAEDLIDKINTLIPKEKTP